MSFDAITLENVFSDNGLLQSALDGFQYRDVQHDMAKAIEHAFKVTEHLCVEAGTGTGKTFAYLVPAMLSRHKVIISTGTKHLQDQLVQRDIPLLQKALKLPLKIAVLKGRANYLCHYHSESQQQAGLFSSHQDIAALSAIRRWAATTDDGDIAGCTTVPEEDPAWRYATSTADNCLGQECPHVKNCFLLKARRTAMQADMVVVNHHLFFADLRLKESGVAELLPQANAVIFDEAHQVPETAAQFLGQTLGAKQFYELIREVTAAHLEMGGDLAVLNTLLAQLKKQMTTWRQAFAEKSQREAWQYILHKPAMQTAMEEVAETLTDLAALLEPLATRSKPLENVWRQTVQLQQQLQVFKTMPDDDVVYWYETYSKSFRLLATPLSIAKALAPLIESSNTAWIFTSATLAVSQSFSFFQEQLGLQDATTLCLDSPFDYENHALFYIPKALPLPKEFEYKDAVLAAALPVIRAARGRTFFLFTSHFAMQHAAKALAAQIDYPILVQGTLPKTQLLEQYRKKQNAILLGTASFWEGVDVRGEALSCVIIDKLPFAAPNDPLSKAKSDAMREHGDDPFRQYHLPKAVIALKQGVGRLIRDANDKGVLMICDPRLTTQSYGKTFLKALPPMRLTRELSDVQQFFEQEAMTT